MRAYGLVQLHDSAVEHLGSGSVDPREECLHGSWLLCKECTASKQAMRKVIQGCSLALDDTLGDLLLISMILEIQLVLARWQVFKVCSFCTAYVAVQGSTAMLQYSMYGHLQSRVSGGLGCIVKTGEYRKSTHLSRNWHHRITEWWFHAIVSWCHRLMVLSCTVVI